MTTRPTPPSEAALAQALGAWATAEPDGAGDSAALARILAHADAVALHPAGPAPLPAPRPGWKPGWLAGGALAASVALAVLLAPTPGAAPDLQGARGGDERGASVMPAEANGGESLAFALLYTPTIEEEYQL